MRVRPLIAARVALGVLVASSIVVASACGTSPPLTCAEGTATGCPSLDGVTTFCAWSAWGCAPEPACGGYFAVVDEAVDARFTYFYAAATGQFVATVSEPSSGGAATCTVGPGSFRVPAGCTWEELADCAPPAKDAGVRIGVEDAGDAEIGVAPPVGSAVR
jgi:hypothetical protein